MRSRKLRESAAPVLTGSLVCLVPEQRQLLLRMTTPFPGTSELRDLNTRPPRSPGERLGGYAILARCLDKGRAELSGAAGAYHFGCRLDHMLFEFKGVTGEDILKLLRDRATDPEVVKWLNSHGITRTPDEVAAWSAVMDGIRPADDPEHREWFIAECHRLDLDPAQTTLFACLDEDDRHLPVTA